MRSAIVLLLASTLLPRSLHADRYEVTISPESPRAASVVAHLTPAGDEIRLDRDAADTGLYHGWATFVHRLTVEDAAGRPLAVEYVPGGRWRLADATEGPVTVRYEVLLQHDRFPSDPGYDELAYATREGVFWTGRALFVEGEPSAEVEVRFGLPEAWRVVAPWEPLEGGNRFRPRDTDALLDNGFVAGTQEVTTLGETSGVQIALAGENTIAQKALVVGLVEGYLESFGELFGTRPDGRLLLVAADAELWGGGVVGSTISLVVGGAVDETTLPLLSFVVVHELFHAWNAAFAVEEEALPALYWLSEGTATYYAYRAAWRRGELDDQTFLARLADDHRRYLDALADVSLAAAGSEKLQQYDLVYSGGVSASLALDLLLRSRSDGAYSLDDVLRALDAESRRPKARAVSKASLAAEIRAVTGVDVGVFLARHVEGVEPLPMAALLATIGVRIEGDAASGIEWIRSPGAARSTHARWESLRRWPGESASP